MARKTFSIERFKSLVNNQIRNMNDADIAGREALILTIETVLMESDNYHGFQYLNADGMKHSRFGTTVGINPHEPHDSWEVKFKNADRTRVRFL